MCMCSLVFRSDLRFHLVVHIYLFSLLGGPPVYIVLAPAHIFCLLFVIRVIQRVRDSFHAGMTVTLRHALPAQVRPFGPCSGSFANSCIVQ